METTIYSLRTATGHITVKVPVKQLDIFSEIRDQYPADREAFSEAKKRYIVQYPEEAREFYGD